MEKYVYVLLLVILFATFFLAVLFNFMTYMKSKKEVDHILEEKQRNKERAIYVVYFFYFGDGERELLTGNCCVPYAFSGGFPSKRYLINCGTHAVRSWLLSKGNDLTDKEVWVRLLGWSWFDSKEDLKNFISGKDEFYTTTIRIPEDSATNIVTEAAGDVVKNHISGETSDEGLSSEGLGRKV